MSNTLPFAVVVLPFGSAVLLALIASWRIGALVNAACTSLLFLLACPLALQSRLAATGSHLILLTSFVAMTTSWFGHRDIAAALAERSLNRRRARLYHAAYQALLGALVLVSVAEDRAVAWLGLTMAVAAAALVTGVVRRPAAARAASRLVLLCGVGLIIALLGILLLDLAPGPATIFLVVGYGAVAGLVPWHASLADAAAEGPAPGAIIVSALMVNVPLMLFMQLRTPMAPQLLIAFGLVSLLVGGASLFRRTELRRTMAYTGLAQLGTSVFAIGLGGIAAPIIITLLALARGAALQCRGAYSPMYAAILILALLPLLAFYLLAGPAVAHSVWLLPPLGAGTLLASWGTLLNLRQCAPPPGRTKPDHTALLPIWLQLALVVLLALAVPAPIAGWFRAMAPTG